VAAQIPISPGNVHILESIDFETGHNFRLTPGDALVALLRPEELECRGRRSTFVELLTTDERERLARYRFPRDQDVYLAAHGLLRLMLSWHEGGDPRAWRFRAGQFGRPEIESPASRLRFSISHTRGIAACAVGIDHDIGLDVETVTSAAPLEVAEHYFSPREQHDLRQLRSQDQSARFFTYWTLKEAYLKARGFGLSMPLDRFSFFEDGDEWRIAFEPPFTDDPARWRFWSWNVGETYRAALASTSV
jgi:4'-phosphopantetheinyl transferase